MEQISLCTNQGKPFDLESRSDFLDSWHGAKRILVLKLNVTFALADL